ncbi:GTPase IMAP family member 7-like [Thalassophryne amazonica]|uniref:GTPase IMAP family member 7-like n=1 Tax=Thalassophryne amazonica TaxID=390379 RepID=UPI00147181B7|nr:GTPase IMAP family member 7-like [Thalassophryne amazonica]XP_034020568.1 GTPase IMAP family member 7-like [Thalassophryne amazonica]
MPVSAHQRIVLLGKTGVGKSSIANLLTKDNVFEVNHSAGSGTSKCKTKSTTVSGRSITVIDTPGFFDTNMNKDELKEEILRCMIESSPGPHVFLILLKVDKYTEEEKAVIKQISKLFSEESFRFAAVVFTRGDQLPEGQRIEEFVDQTDDLRDLVKKCGGRCHVIDNKYWKKPQDDYRNNEVQVAELFKTIDKIIEEKNGGYYTNKMLQKVEEQIAEEEQLIRESSGNLTEDEIREQAKETTLKKLLIISGATVGGALLGILCGVIAVAAAPALPVGATLAVGATVGLTAAGTTATAVLKRAKILDTIREVFVYANDVFNSHAGYHRMPQEREHQS